MSLGKLWRVVTTVSAVGLLSAAVTGCSEPRADVATDTSAANAPELAVSVTATAVQRRMFEERVTVQGTLEAKNFALVAPQVPGTIEKIYVEEGGHVVAGETELFLVDRVKLAKAVDVAEQDLAMAKSARASAQARIEQVEADLHKAKLDYDRFAKLLKQGAVTADAAEQQEARLKQATAAVKYAKALERQAAEQESQARAAIEIAEKDLADALVIAPISGQVSDKLKEAGEFVGVGKPVLRIDDPAVLEVSAFLPAQYYPRVTVGETHVRLTTYGVDLGEVAVAYKSPTINPKLRTFEIKCVLENAPSPAVPGAMVDLAVVLDRREALGVPEGALQTRQGSQVVFIVDGAKAGMAEVEPGLRSDGWVEVTWSQLSDGTLVVTQGQYMLDHGAAITVSRED